MKRFQLITAALFLILSFNAAAQGYPPQYGYVQPYNPYPNYAQQTPAQLLQMGVQVLQDYLKSGELDSEEKMLSFLDAQMSSFFDFEQMARWAAGYHYNRMNSAQQYIFQTNLKKMFFAAFARIVTAYGDKQPRVTFLPARRSGYNEYIVTARVMPSNNYPIRVDFRFAQGPSGWKIYDVGTNGSSAVAYYRAYFNNLIRSRGFNALLQQ